MTLVGLKLYTSKVSRWNIGDAEVRLVPLGDNAFVHRARRRRSARRMLAYPGGPTTAYRKGVVEYRRQVLLARLGQLAVARRSGAVWRARAGHLALCPSRIALKVLRPWVRLREEERHRLEVARASEKALLTRFHVWFRTTFWGDRSWRYLDPAILDLELAFGPVIDKLRPDIIHANDFHTIGVGARAKMRAALRGRSIKLVWDAHELVSGVVAPPGRPRWLAAQIAHEREFAPYADAVITVSPMLADLLQANHRLTTRPTVVLNAPKVSVDTDDAPDLRSLCGLDDTTPVLAYSGAIARQRGLHVAIDALPQLPGVHLVLLSLAPDRTRAAADALEAQAAALGVADRLHLLPYLPHHQVVPFLSGANAAISPLEHTPNHEVALTNKSFEYAHAGLPQVVSDVRSAADMVRATGIGEVFRAGDVDDFARAARAVLEDPARYRAGYDKPGLLDEWTWERQSAILDAVYGGVLEVAPTA
ncbi:glycosyltransferase family 4 protein [Actinoplanes sp. NBRC 103695]|uniref:glycosyltransferase family 4 protein n=1 Tax=Actinoplanes sp. NBRC 103695 TaxID=3032202 RepID=UPI002552420A|nr:glycosyltransferase family 4 protein [Actinoplanes sp. NBRC 103695]